MPRGARVGAKFISRCWSSPAVAGIQFLGRLAPLFPELLSCQLSTGYERLELLDRDLAIHRRHAAVGAREEVLHGHELRGALDDLGDLARRLDRVARDIDDAD